MKNFLSSCLVLVTLLLSPFALGQQVFYQYFDTECSDPLIIHKASSDSYTATIFVSALSSLASSPQEIFDELNQRISDATTPSLEERFPGVRFKVRDEDMEYNKTYFDQSEDGNIQVVRIKNRGDAVSTGCLSAGYTTFPDIICTWIRQTGNPSPVYECFSTGEKTAVTTWIDSSLSEADRQCTRAHRNQHVRDYNTYLKRGIRGNLAAHGLDHVENITGYRKQIDELDAKIELVLEAEAMRAELECLDKMVKRKIITQEEKTKKEEALRGNRTPLSITSPEGKGVKSIPRTFREPVVIQVDQKTDVTLEPVPIKDETTGQSIDVITYGEIYSKLGNKNTKDLLEKLVNEKERIMTEIGTSIRKEETAVRVPKSIITECEMYAFASITVNRGGRPNFKFNLSRLRCLDKGAESAYKTGLLIQE